MASIKVPTLLQYLVYFQLLSLSLPNHWIKQFFLAQMYLELQLNDEALRIYQELEENSFHKSSYIVTISSLFSAFITVSAQSLDQTVLPSPDVPRVTTK